MVRPTLRLSDDFGAVLKYHCAKKGKTMNQFVAELLYDELIQQHGALMKDIKKETICV